MQILSFTLSPSSVNHVLSAFPGNSHDCDVFKCTSVRSGMIINRTDLNVVDIEEGDLLHTYRIMVHCKNSAMEGSHSTC